MRGTAGLMAFVAAWLVLFAPARADDEQAARERFKKQMDAVYDYLPFDVTQDVRNAKIAKMDEFWAFVAGDSKTARRISDEAMGEIEALTGLIRRAVAPPR